MKKNSLMLLLVAAVVLIALAVVTSKSRRPAQGTSGKKVFEQLAINNIARVVVTTPEKSVTLAVKNERWVCTNTFDYPIQFDKFKRAVLKLEEMKGQPVNADAARRDALKMNLPSSGKNKDTLGTLIEFLAADGKPVAALLLGEQRMRKPKGGGPEGEFGGYPDGRYVSPDKGQTVMLVGETLDDFTGDGKSWLDSELTSLYSSDIATVAIRHPGQPAIRLAKPAGKATFEVEGLGPDEETDDVKASSAAGALSYLRLDDVASPAITDEQAGMKDAVVFEAAATNGEVYTAIVGTATNAPGDMRYVRLKVSLPPAGADASSTNAVNTRKDQEKKVADLNAKFAGWTYLVSSYKADNMTVKRDAIVKKKAKPAATNETAAAASPGNPAAEAGAVK